MNAPEMLALTLRAEAGTRPVRAIEALAAMVVNRARLAAEGAASRARFAPGAAMGSGWAALVPFVCRAPFLFGCWATRHPRRAVLLSVLQGQAAAAGGALPEPQPDLMLEVCRRIAGRAAGGALPDPTEGATHWHDACEMPGWAIGRIPTIEVGGLVFYRLV
jgi:N-acetylmuramoyl-L-alanine amidase